MIKNISHIYLHLILKNPKRVLLVMLLVLISMLPFSANFKLDASADSLILENDKDLLTYKDIVERYSTQEFIIMTYTPKQGKIFDVNNLLLIKNLKESRNLLSFLLSLKGFESFLKFNSIKFFERYNL